MQSLKILIISPLAVMLLFPTMLWAITPCEQASDYVTETYDLDNIIHQSLQKNLLQQALTLCPEHPEAHHHFAVILAQENNQHEALYHYQQALKKRPNYPQAWFGIGEIYYHQSQWPLSIEAYLQVCNTHQKARQRVAELLRDNRYRTADGNVVLNFQCLTLLYDNKRLQGLHQKVAQCRIRDRSIAPDTNTVRAILQPLAIFQQIHFNMEQHDLSLVSEEQLDHIALTLTEMKAKHIIIRGHSNSQTFKGKTKAESDRLNWQLSQDRAKAVKSALNQRGVFANRIKIYGYGNTRPLIKDNNEIARLKNRRVEIEVSY